MSLPELFRLHLQSQKVSSVTVKNYVADINNFLDWLATKTGVKHQVAGNSVFGLLTRETIEEFKTDLTQEGAPLATINRRLSALRKFGQFGLAQGWLTRNEATRVKNLRSLETKERTPNEKVLTEFRKHLEQEKISQITIKNYLSDLRHFLSWLEVT